MNLFSIKSASSLALFFEKQDFSEKSHLLVLRQKELEKLKAFLMFKRHDFFWKELTPFPKAKSSHSSLDLLKRRSFQSLARDGKKGLYLSSPEALLKKTNPSTPVFKLKVGDSFPLNFLKHYKERAFVTRPGDFARRGHLLDIFSPSHDRPLRLELLGESLQSIHMLDEDFEGRGEEMSSLILPFPFEWSVDIGDRKNLCDHLRKLEESQGVKLPYELFQHVSRGESFYGFEALLNSLDNFSSLDLFEKKPQIWFYEPESLEEEFLKETENFEKDSPFFLKEELFLSFESLKKEPHSSISKYQDLKGENTKNQSFTSFVFKRSKKSLKEDLKDLPCSSLIFVSFNLDEMKRRLFKEGILDEKGEFFEEKSLLFKESSLGLKESFYVPREEAYLFLDEFLEKKKTVSSFDFFRQKAKALEFSELEEGDLLVHRQHGVGQFSGLKSMERGGKREDFIVLQFKGGDKLLLPAYRASQVKKYSKKRSVGKAWLDTLGNPKSWDRKKAQAKKHIDSLAIELIEMYRLRKQRKRKAFEKNEDQMQEFAKEFPFEETLDQRQAIGEIMEDLDGQQPMDRLLTADTGFGKTEVALRAAFRVLSNGFQVCLLSPTTVLALQHFSNFKKRLENFPFNLAILNRFVSKKEAEEVFERVRSGEVDFLISTHAVFNSKLNFKNLGLLILDEEHRFGVKQKEKLFRFKDNLDALSLSATPIPRTLNMALTGIKDISVLAKAPEKRKPVKLRLQSWDEGAEKEIIKASMEEKKRGGQILFVHNRVKSIFHVAEKLQSLLPSLKIAVAHGQMKNLDQIVVDFFNKKYDMLISTNIIESGMDIPEANTLFIDKSHEMGLAQIYQLKGRVGRAKKQAYCYLLFPSEKRLTGIARERLELLKQHAHLGSSFQLALHDLENRGAGSLFGSEQSGHLQNLGEDLYFEILNERLRPQKNIFIEPEIQLPFSSGIPHSYMPDARLRLLYYKSLSSSDPDYRKEIEYELVDNFGNIPEELHNLFYLLNLRDICKKLLIKKLNLKEDKVSITFHEKTRACREKILSLIEKKEAQMEEEDRFKIILKSENIKKDLEKLLLSFLKKDDTHN